MAVLLGMALLGLGTTAMAGAVSGSLELPAELPAAAREEHPPFYWEEWNGFLDPKPRRIDATRDVAVVLLGEGPGAPNEFKLLGGDLMPSTMVARGGADIRIVNTDGCTHELYSDDVEGLTPLSTAPGNARSFAAPAPGSYVIRDRLYGHIEGHLHVVQNLVARAVPDATGRFTFGEIAPGTYTVKAFYGAREVGAREIEVTSSPLTVDPIRLNLAE
jgi:hypothetical protein